MDDSTNWNLNTIGNHCKVQQHSPIEHEGALPNHDIIANEARSDEGTLPNSDTVTERHAIGTGYLQGRAFADHAV